MNEQDVFRKIVLGVKFDQEKFVKNSHRFHKAPTNPLKISEVKPSLDLDFFKKEKALQASETNACTGGEEKIPIKGLNDSSNKFETDNSSGFEDNLEKSVKRKLKDKQKTKNKKLKLTSSATLRKLHKIYVEGADIPELITNFEQLQSVYGFNKICLQNIIAGFGFSNLTPIQMQAIPAMLHEREILACAPTGSGKTLSFLIPVIHHLLSPAKSIKKNKKGFRVLILSPTKELAEQTLRVCKLLVAPDNDDDSKKRKPLLRVKLLTKKETKAFNTAGSSHSNKIDLLISTPQRLLYLLNQDKLMISLNDVEWLVVDESDKLFEEGKKDQSFRDQLGIIYAACTNKKIRRAMFSATFAFDVQQWCVLNMDNVLQVTVGGKNTAVDTVEQELQYVGNEQGKLLALRQTMFQGFSPPVLVFVQSKERAKQLFVELIYDGKNVDAIHSDRTPAQRENAIKSFRKGDTWILICTELLGRGMDFKGVNLVVNYDFPTSAISYIHRIGRTGRAGRQGKAVTFFTDDDKPLLRTIANVIRQAGCQIPEFMLKMKKIQTREKKKLAKRDVKRRPIRTAPSHDVKKKKSLKDRSKRLHFLKKGVVKKKQSLSKKNKD